MYHEVSQQLHKGARASAVMVQHRAELSQMHKGALSRSAAPLAAFASRVSSLPSLSGKHKHNVCRLKKTWYKTANMLAGKKRENGHCKRKNSFMMQHISSACSYGNKNTNGIGMK